MKVRKKRKSKSNLGWIIKIIIMSFVISISFSFASESLLKDANTIIGTIILVVFILIGVLFDMIGVSVTSAEIGPFNSMSARKVFGSDVAVKFIKNADKVSSFCNDVVGDICGIISGSAGVMVANNLAKTIDFDRFLVMLFVTGIVAALTIGGKAIGKGIAINNSTKILHDFSEIVAIIYKPKK